jgi:quinol monooxygenase YgiN
MTRGALTRSSRGAVAAGATAAGAASLGAVALGAVALGAIAVGALAVGRLSVGRARLRRVEIGELAVGRLDVGAVGTAGRLTAFARIRAMRGKGDALERLLLEQLAKDDPDALLDRAHRSAIDPDSFLICESYADEAAFEGQPPTPRLNALLRQAAEKGLVAASDGAPVEVELYRTI